MSVEELQARIKKISADIEQQKKILNDLERSKRLAERQLNAVRDPVAQLPLEISSEIFLQSLPPLSEPRAHHIPMLLLNVCSAWTDIALSTPALWASIHIGFPRAQGFPELLCTWLQRARNRPLSVSLSGTLDEEVAAIVWRHNQQIRHLTICQENGEDDDEISDLIGGLTPGPLPLLEALAIHGSTDPGDARQEFPNFQILQLLRLAPNLVECIFENVCPVSPRYGGDNTQNTTLPSLRRLLFGPNVEDPDSDDSILRHLTLPRLEALSLSMIGVSDDNFLSFLKRSSPPLRDFVVSGRGRSDFTLLAECLFLVPTLARFELWYPNTTLAEDLFAALANPSLRILPNLEDVTIRHPFSSTVFSVLPGSFWEMLLRALSARRTQIRVVHIETSRRPEPSKPAADILAAFRELAADGMDIFVGTGEQNLLTL
ncbi:hypothetical protein B0H11DRAFT_323287 [Mycena galericulata]|nr:hypothetical protein B0H11DRAFT_323287 [Mycena galericulata]